MKKYKVVALTPSTPALVGKNKIYPIIDNIWGHGRTVTKDMIEFRKHPDGSEYVSPLIK